MKISVKLDKDILILKMDEERSYADQKEDIKKYLLGIKSFLSNGNVRFGYEGCDLSFDEEIELCHMADNAFGYEVSFVHRKMPPHSVTRHLGGNGERLVKKVYGTVKAGEVICSNGDVLVLGDVNPTSEINAAGDIFVIGNLRGVAHAGCTGDENCVVYAMRMNPVMVKIANKIGFVSSNGGDNLNGMAQIIDGEIKVKLV